MNAQLEVRQEAEMKQLDSDPKSTTEASKKTLSKDSENYGLGWAALLLIGVLLFGKETIAFLRKGTFWLLLLTLPACTGCWRPFEPVQLEEISTNEEAFLLPYTDGVEKQSSTNSEEYYKQKLVFARQIKIPQQWVQKGYEWMGANGEWRPAARLVKVDKSPVTREWTADSNSGTSNKNEAIWVMTSDQVEFSTGWTCTARIGSHDDAVKFLHNYPSGSLHSVMDTEVRAKIQTVFGLEVTDQAMDKLRKEATPHILKTVAEVKTFFEERGITITNLGISGGFVYKDPLIMQKMVQVFTAEQEKSIAIAESVAQEQRNKTVQFTADGKAQAMLTEKQAEADGIKKVADAKAYEIEKANQDKASYLALKALEIQKAQTEKWDGKFPVYFMGGSSPNMLLQMPAPDVDKK